MKDDTAEVPSIEGREIRVRKEKSTLYQLS